MANDPRPIGVFDSGIGGITVLRELVKKFPAENFVYLGDTARLPYGTKSAETVKRYSEQNLKFLISKKVKAIIVACNTASTQISEPEFQNIPLYTVIGPGAHLAGRATKNNKIAVLATRATIKANTYEIKIKAEFPRAQIFSVACPLFVPLAEEGWHDDPLTDEVASRYLSNVKTEGVDTVVLACTHYPLLKKSIGMVFGPKVQLIDSGEAVSEILDLDFKKDFVMKNDSQPRAEILICLTDFGPQFEALSRELLRPYTTKQIVFETVAVI